MSLLKQLLISVTVAIVAILIGTLAFSIGAARQYLDGQLQSESENAASSLALSLSQPANQDPVTQELLMMALFDGGQFKLIRLASPEGETLFERRRDKDITDSSAPAAKLKDSAAPPWFVEMLPLRSPKAERVISDGWKQVGQLTLVVDDSYASQALWGSSVRLTGVVVLAGLAWAAVDADRMLASMRERYGAAGEQSLREWRDLLQQAVQRGPAGQALLLVAAGVGWLVVFLPWASRLVPIYLTRRSDGRDG